MQTNINAEQKYQQKIRKLEEIVQRDEGNRGIKPLIIQDELMKASFQLLDSKNICIITGFQCLLDYEIKTETDGPLGAFVIAHTLLNLQKNVQIITDSENDKVISVAYQDYQNIYKNSKLQLTIINTNEKLETNEIILKYLIPNCDHIISIERCGPSVVCAELQDKHYYTMKGRDMNLITAPLENFIIYAEKNKIKTTGIGDGGNECGMGKVIEQVQKNIFKGELIGTYIKTENLIVASVSNWGGYALSASITFIFSNQNIENNINKQIEKLILNDKDQIQLLQEMIKAGARDGTNYKQEMSVDGFSIEKNLDILQELIKCISQ